ncbi:hypothetical protein RHSIM_Rhsim04G0094500 [Rhododendron simsii]|uniref:Uncharacterized protein n=1 Tax=Rhododendron simsii TaxID=118357 RepID=A0A834LMF3_RHOSS|nr:hypothetical protein RHSIM_Rhsim04G0094500 [Rhododendron simsii]
MVAEGGTLVKLKKSIDHEHPLTKTDGWLCTDEKLQPVYSGRQRIRGSAPAPSSINCESVREVKLQLVRLVMGAIFVTCDEISESGRVIGSTILLIQGGVSVLTSLRDPSPSPSLSPSHSIKSALSLPSSTDVSTVNRVTVFVTATPTTVPNALSYSNPIVP